MKTKKMFAVFIALILSLSIVPSAFAQYGFGDTRSEAELIPPGYGYGSTIESGSDGEWTFYQNLTGKTLVVRPILKSPDGLNYDFLYLHYLSNGQQDMLIAARDNGAGAIDTADIILRPGETVYFNVFWNDSSLRDPSARYSFNLQLIYSE